MNVLKDAIEVSVVDFRDHLPSCTLNGKHNIVLAPGCERCSEGLEVCTVCQGIMGFRTGDSNLICLVKGHHYG